MRKLLLLLIATLVLFGLYTSPIKASGFVWTLAYPSIRESTYITSYKSNPSIIYASIRKWTDIDVLKSTDLGFTWSSIKNNLPVGNADVNWIATYPNDPNFIVISVWGPTGGIFLSESGGASWTRIYTSQFPRSVAIDPTNNNIIFVGIGGNNDSNSGVYKTIDRGMTWQKISELGSRNNSQININPADHNFIIADSDPDFFRSTDGGINWTKLPIQYVYSTGSIFDSNNATLYSGVFWPNIGVYSSTNYGNTWIIKNNGFNGNPFHLSQNTNNGELFVTNGGGQIGKLWKSNNGGNSWENVGDPSWAGKNVWGLDVSNDRVFVSVEGLGIYYADTNLEPNPVVFIPGFLGSWSYKGLIENQSTTYSDWKLLPVFSDTYYQPLLSTLKNSGLTEDQNLFTFAYDFRKSVSDSATSLNTFLSDKTPNKKVDIIAHSMGGLVARYCQEKISGCSDKIGKIITAGTPHKGLINAYQLWEGGQFDADPIEKLVEEIVLHSTNLPYLTNKEIIQNKMPGVKDLLPIFDYISGKPYSALSSQAKNPILESLSASPSINTLSGKGSDTKQSFTTTSRSAIDSALGLWADGKPNNFTFGIGDRTVLKTSSNIGGNDYAIGHKDYFRTTQTLTDITNLLELNPLNIVTNTDSIDSILSFMVHSPVTISVKDESGNPVGSSLDGKTIFIKNPTTQNYQVILLGTGNGTFDLDSIFSSQDILIKKTISDTISLSEEKSVNFKFTPNSAQNFLNNQYNIYLSSFNSKISLSKNRSIRSISATINRAVSNIINNKNRNTSLNTLEKSYIDINNLLKAENQPLERKNIENILEQLLTLVVDLNQKYGAPSTLTVALTEQTRAQKSFDKKIAKSTLLVREAANLAVAQEFKKTADDLIIAGNYYQAVLLFRGINYLLN